MELQSNSKLSTPRSDSGQQPEEGRHTPTRFDTSVFVPERALTSFMTFDLQNNPKLVPVAKDLASEESPRVITGSTVFDEEESVPAVPEKETEPATDVSPKRFYLRTDPSIPLSPPKPLVCYLPPSPFISRDGRLELGDYPGPVIHELEAPELPQVVLEAVQAMAGA